MLSKRLVPLCVRRTLATAPLRYSDKTKVPRLVSVDEAFPHNNNNNNHNNSLAPPFDEVIDVRTAAEYLEDHLPGATNVPVLDETERALVGKLHADDAFRGHKVGAGLISTNIGRIIGERFVDKAPDYSPLIYCWRGGLRSHSLALVLANVGFDVAVLEGGHKAYRERVRADLEALPSSRLVDLRVISGPTGSGKSALLRLLRESSEGGGGEQTLDLEALAEHKGSVLGRMPDGRGQQPTQKQFESRLWWALRHLDPAAPVWVESESKRIGDVVIPDPLFDVMRRAPRIDLVVPLEERVRRTIEEYDYFIRDPRHLKDCLARLMMKKKKGGSKKAGIVTAERWEKWERFIDAADWPRLVESLLLDHYDPTYANSQAKNSAACVSRTTLEVNSFDSRHLRAVIIPELLESPTRTRSRA